MKKLIFSIASLAIVFASCSDDDDDNTVTDSNVTTAAVLAGGPYAFCAGDGVADNITEDIVVDAGTGSLNSFVVTDENKNILGLPGMASGPDFDGAGVGMCYVYHINYEEGLVGLTGPDEAGASTSNLADLVGDFSLSNFLTVNRNDCEVVGATITGGPYSFCVDGEEDRVTDVAITDAGAGSESTFVITDTDLNILGLPPTLEALATGPEFDSAGAGVCYIWHMNYETGLVNLAVDSNVNDLVGSYALSDMLEVTRTETIAGVISGGTDNVYTFTAGDSVADMATDLSIDGSTSMGTGRTWIITKDDGEILGLPATLEMAQGNDFDGAGVGTCLIWYMRYEGTLEDVGAIVGNNALTDLTGCYDLSNEVTVNRVAPVLR